MDRNGESFAVFDHWILTGRRSDVAAPLQSLHRSEGLLTLPLDFGIERLHRHRMRMSEELPGHLTIRPDHGKPGVGFDRIRRSFQIESGVRGRMEDVDGVHSWRTVLFVAEDQVNPVLEVIPHPTRFQCLSVDQNEQPSVSVTPRRKLEVIHRFTCIKRQKNVPFETGGTRTL